MFEIEDLFDLTLEGAFTTKEEFIEFASAASAEDIYPLLQEGAFTSVEEMKESTNLKKKDDTASAPPTEDATTTLVSEEVEETTPSGSSALQPEQAPQAQATGQELFDTLFEVAPLEERDVETPEAVQEEDLTSQYAERVRNSRTSTRKNEDGSESTVLMAQSDNYAYPTLFQEDDGTWTELEPDAAFERAKKEDELYVFKNEEEAMRFAEGAWKQEDTLTVSDTGEVIDFRTPTVEEEEELAITPEEATIGATAPPIYSYGNELYNADDHAQKKQESAVIIEETIPTETPAGKDYSEVFEKLQVKLTEQYPDSPQFVETETRRVQKEILENDILKFMDEAFRPDVGKEAFGKIPGVSIMMDEEGFLTMSEIEMEKLKKGYRDRGFPDDIVDNTFYNVMESRRDDVAIENQINVFKQSYPQFNDEQLGKFIYRNAMSEGVSLFSDEEKKISNLRRELQRLMAADEDEMDYIKIAKVHDQLKLIADSGLYNELTGIRIDQENLAYDEKVIEEAKEIQKLPKFRDQLRDGMVKSYLAHTRLDKLYKEEYNNLKTKFDPSARVQQRQYGFTPYEEQANKVETLYNLRQQARIKQDAWSRLFLLNEDPALAEKGIGHYTELMGKSALQAFFGAQATNRHIPPTQRERFDVMESMLAGEDIELTEKQKKNIKRDFSEDIAELGGSLVGVVGQFALLNKAAKIMKLPELIKVLEIESYKDGWEGKKGRKISKVAAFLMAAALEEEKFRAIGGEHTAGATFYATQRALPDIAFKGKIGRILNPIVNILYKADIGMTTASNVSATVATAVRALQQDREFSNLLKQQYGTLSDFQHHVLTELSVNWMFGLGHGKGPKAKQEIIKTSEQLSRDLDQVIKEFKAEGKDPEIIAELEQFQAKLKEDTQQLSEPLTKTEEDAIQKPSTEEGVLRPEETKPEEQVGLREVGDVPKKEVTDEVTEEAEIEKRRQRELSGFRSEEKIEIDKKEIKEGLDILEEIAKHGKTFEEAFDALMGRIDPENPVSRLRKEGLTDEQIDTHPDFLKWKEIDKLIDSFKRFGIDKDGLKTPVAEAIKEEKEKLEALPTQKVRLSPKKIEEINARHDAALAALGKQPSPPKEKAEVKEEVEVQPEAKEPSVKTQKGKVEVEREIKKIDKELEAEDAKLAKLKKAEEDVEGDADFFFPSPSIEGNFEADFANKTYKQGRDIWQVKKTGEDIAELDVVPESTAHEVLLEVYKKHLEPVATRRGKVGYEEAQSVTITKRPKIRKEGDKWVLVEKGEFEFSEKPYTEVSKKKPVDTKAISESETRIDELKRRRKKEEGKLKAKPTTEKVEAKAPAKKKTLKEVIEERRKGTGEAVTQQVENARKAIAKILPEVEIVVHKTEEAYLKAVGEDAAGERGSYNPTTKTIDINLSKASKATVAHEVFHAVLLSRLKTDKNIRAVTKRMMEAVSKSIKGESELKDALDNFAAEYETNIRNEEKLATLTGILAENYDSLSKPAQSVITRWLQKISKMLGLRKITDIETIDLLNTLSRKVAGGEELTIKDVEAIREGGSVGVGEPTTLNKKSLKKRSEIDFKDSYPLSFVTPKDAIDLTSLIKDIQKGDKKVWFWMADQLGRGEYFDLKIGENHYLDAGPSYALDPVNRKDNIIWATGKGPKWVNRYIDADYLFILSSSPKTSKLFNKRVLDVYAKRLGDYKSFKKEALAGNPVKDIREVLEAHNSWETLRNDPNRKRFLNSVLKQQETPNTSFHKLMQKKDALLDINELRDGFYRENDFGLNDVMLVLKPTKIGGKSKHSTYQYDILGEVVGVPNSKVNAWDIMTTEFKSKYDQVLNPAQVAQAIAPYGAGVRQVAPPTLAKRMQKVDGINEIVKIAREAKFSDSETREYLKLEGYSDAMISKAIGKEGIKWEQSEGRRPPRKTKDTPMGELVKSYEKGEITIEEYNQKAEELMPTRMKTKFIAPTTEKQLGGLHQQKRGKINAPIKQGAEVGLRIDIPLMHEHGLSAVTIHPGRGLSSTPISYRGSAVIENVEFKSHPKHALELATERKTKSPTLARMAGDFVSTGKTIAEQNDAAKKLVQEAIDKGWTQVGVNPSKHSYFYDRATGKPLKSADRVVQVGDLVYAENAKTTDIYDPRFIVKGKTDKEGRALRFQKMQKGEGIDEIVKIAREEKFSDQETREYLKGEGYSDKEISDALQEPSKERVDKIIEGIKEKIKKRKFGKDTNPEVILEAAEGYLQGTKFYEEATDIQREDAVRELRSSLGIKSKKAPSVKKILGQPPRKKVLVDDVAERKKYWKGIEKAIKASERGTKKETRIMQKKLVSLVKENIKDLQKVSGRSMPALMKKIANVQAGKPKALQDAIDYINKIVSGQAEKERIEAIESVRNTVESALSKSRKKDASGRLKATSFTEEGRKSLKALQKAFDMTEQQATERGPHIEAEINSLEVQRLEELTDAKKNKIDDKILELQKEAEYIELYSDLNNKSKAEVDGVGELLKEEISSLKEDLKAKRKEKSEQFKKKKESLVEGIEERMEEDIWEEEPKKPGVGAAYLSMQLNPKNILTQLAGKAGEPFAKGFDVGAEKAISTALEMKKSVKEAIKDFFGSESKMRKVLNKEVKINLTKEVTDSKGNVTQVSSEPRKVKVSSLVHLWASYKSESNHIYTQRIASGKDRLKLSPEEWLRIDELLPTSAKNFTDWIVEDLLPKHYPQANKVYYDRNFINLPKLPDYLFVNAERVRDVTAALTDINRVSTYKPFTTQRVYGEYNLWGNDIYSGLMKHIEQHSKFVGLSKPISEVNALLNSKDVSRLIKQRGLQPYKRALEARMTVGMVGEKRYLIDKLFHNFIGSKVLMNLSLFPKQVTSVITTLDPQYVPTTELIKSIYNISTNRQAARRAKDILKTSGGFSTRNIKEIETNVKEGKPWLAEQKINEIAEKMDDHRLTEAIKNVGEFIWNPTQKGDRFTIRLGGIPLIDAAYRVKLKGLIKEGAPREEAERIAANEALYKFNEWMNDTQQSMLWTGKSEFQSGMYRFAAPFMNAPMSYSRKIITSYRDVYRGAKGERDRLLKENPTMNPHVATIKSLKGVKQGDLQRIALYQMALPVLWSFVTTAGRSIVNLWSDDEETREQAWMDLGYDTTLGWTKGLYGIGFLMDYMYGDATGRKYGRQADNFIRVFDDSMNMITSLFDVITGNVKLAKDLTDEEYDKQEARVDKAYKKAAENIVAVVGGPQVFVKRMGDISTDETYDTEFKKLLRLYGMREQSIKEWSDFEEESESGYSIGGYVEDGASDEAEEFYIEGGDNVEEEFYVEED